MFRVVLVLLACAISCRAFAQQTAAPESEQDVLRAVAISQVLGSKLADAVQSDRKFDLATLMNFSALSPLLEADSCPKLIYTAYTVPLDTGGMRVYILGANRDDRSVVIGRHFSVNLAGNAADLGSLTSSTKACVIMEKSKSGAPLFISHLMSTIPSEFHVYVSIAQAASLFVSTPSGIWAVKEGQIRKVQR